MIRKESQTRRRKLPATSLLPTLPALAAVYETSTRSASGANPSKSGSRSMSRSERSSSPSRQRTAPAGQPRQLPPLRTRDADEALRERRKQEAVQRRQEVLAQRLEALLMRQEREARAEVALSEKTAFHALQRRASADALRVHSSDGAAPQRATPDTVLRRNAVLAQGSPARSRRLNRGVGLGIGGLMHAVEAASPYENTAAAPSAALNRTAGPTAAVYRAHDMRTEKSRAMAKPRYPQPVSSPRGPTSDNSIAAYEVRLLTVREAQRRAGAEADACTKLQWLYDAEFRARLVALDRARHSAVAAADAEKRRRQLVASTVASAVDGALAGVADGFAAAVEAAESAIKAALKSRKRVAVEA